MQPENFPENFIDRYLNYARDGFVPDKLHLWAGISIVAAALERRVWLPWSDAFSYHPNLYMLLVAQPGMGKSTALNLATGLLRDFAKIHKKPLNFLPAQMTEAKFIELMSVQSPYEYRNMVHYQSAGYFVASEASNSLKNLYGDFIACLTDFYDCPQVWEKATVIRDRQTLTNVCLNLIAGSTFDYLGKLITRENIMGGFASRLIYVVNREKLKRTSTFQGGTSADDKPEERQALLAELARISQITGPFSADSEFKDMWESWFEAYDAQRQSLESEVMQTLLVRKSTNIIKLCMIMCAAEESDRVLKVRHWKRAEELATDVEKDLAFMLQEAEASNPETQSGINAKVARIMKHGSISEGELKQRLFLDGVSVPQIDATVSKMLSLKLLIAQGNGKVELGPDFKKYSPIG